MSTNVNTEAGMNRKLGTVAMLISATAMGLVPLFGRMSTYADMYDPEAGINAGKSVGAFMATGRMTMGLVFFFILVVLTGKFSLFKQTKLTAPIALGGLFIGLSLGCYVTSTLLTNTSYSVLLIYTGPVVCVVLARIFRKEPISWLQYCCLLVVFVGMLFGSNLMGWKDGAFFADLNIFAEVPGMPMAGIGNIFGLASGLFYGASMFFNGYNKEVDSSVRGIWNFLFAALGAGGLCLILNTLGTTGTADASWALDLHLSTFNWISAAGFWVICGPVALGLLLVAGRHLPAPDYGVIAYWEVPVAVLISFFILGEPFTINTAIGSILIIGGGAIPTLSTMMSGKKAKA